ncbi:MAG: hypothetical protein O7H41_00450 [Planctomycetota bacterium]|nr:hypothetical protein [Planctomycetota bacterium]
MKTSRVSGQRGRLVGWAVIATIAVAIPLGCGGGSSSKKKSSPALPVIQNINGSSDPASPASTAIEINGLDFGSAPGEVHFTDATDPSNVAIEIPVASAWSDFGIVVVVPAAGCVGNFPIPGTVAVTVVTAGGTSNGIDLDFVDTPSFSVNTVTWMTTTPLPTALRGLGTSPVRVDDVSAYAVIAGGNDGSAHLDLVYTYPLSPDGTLGAWRLEASSLPAPRAYHGMVEANPGNAPLINSADRFVYVLGGQQDPLDAPGGTDTAFMARVDLTNGSVGTWSQTTTLPEPLIGPTVTIYNGHVYLIGGLRSDGTPTDAVHSARIRSNGTLEPWLQATDPYPVPISFGRVFGFGASIYVVGGDPNGSMDPSEQSGSGQSDVYYASARNGTVGAWTAGSSTIARRKKHILWSAFGQMISAEGIYQGGPGSQVAERSSIQPDGTISTWRGMTGSNILPIDVFNASAFVSPIRVFGGAPRFMMFGGELLASPAGQLSDAVYYNDAP